MTIKHLLGWLTLAAPASLDATVPGPGTTVVVVYNQQMSESKSLAEYYASRRQVPASQVFGFELPKTESMTRQEYRDLLLYPLVGRLQAQGLLTFATETAPDVLGKPGQTYNRVRSAKIRYALLCYGVPLRILRDTNLVEKGSANVRPEMRRNEAAVDNELALLPICKNPYPLFGPVGNPLFACTNAVLLDPTNALLLVTRLDGPSVAVARGLVDKALQAEADGLWGRAYFDARGLTNGAYRPGDDSIRSAAEVCRQLGFETILDTKPETFPPSFPMSQIAFYGGWYDANVSGPFARAKVEFMPGAFAYHLHSFSAQTLRSPTLNWVGPLLSKGATIAMGCVDEPYLELTPHIGIFLERLFAGFTFGEAAYASQDTLSWQTTVVGDPLYRPFGRSAQTQHEDLLRRKSRLIEWSYLRAVDLNQAKGMAETGLINHLESIPETAHSPILEEKLGDLYRQRAEPAKAVSAYTALLRLDPTPQQRVRVTLQLSQLLEQQGQKAAAFDLLQKFLKDFSDYPDPASIYHKLLPLSRALNKTSDIARYQRLLDRLPPAASTR